MACELTSFSRDVDKKTPYLLRHCDKPTIEPIVGSIVKGKIPSWLTGTLIRNGPGIRKIGENEYTHFFDGLAVLHRFHVENGNVTYSSRPLESDTYRKNISANRIMVTELGTVAFHDPCDTLFNKFKTSFVRTDNCSVNIGYYGDQLYAMTETNFVRRIDPINLKCIGRKTNLTKYVAINQASAHPHILPDGTVLNLGIKYWSKSKGTCYCIISVPPSYKSSENVFEKAKILAEIPIRWPLYPCYYHSFGITSDRIVFIEQPLCIRVPKIFKAILNNEVIPINFFRWYPNKTTRIHVVSMKDGKLHPVIYGCKNLFTFHHCNTYEEDGHVIVDVAAYNTGEFIFMGSNQNQLKKPLVNQARRYVLPLDVSKANLGVNFVTLRSTTATAYLRPGTKNKIDLTPEVLSAEMFDLPRINYKYNGKKYKYLYGVSSSQSQYSDSRIPESDTLVKLDLDLKVKKIWSEKDILVSEPVFVQNSTIVNPAEDDGVILASLLHRKDEYKTTFLVLDAKNMEEIARVDFKAKGIVTSTFHGKWASINEKQHFY